jgi:hypothetical protein
VLSLSGRLTKDGPKIRNIPPDTLIKNDQNFIQRLKVELRKFFVYNIANADDPENLDLCRKIRIDGEIFSLYKFLKVQTLMKIIMYKSNIQDKWPYLLDVESGIYYDGNAELYEIGNDLNVVWMDKSEKRFKVKLDELNHVVVKEDRFCTVKELIKATRKLYGIGKEACFTNEDANVKYIEGDGAFFRRENLFLRGTSPVCDVFKGRMIDMNILVESMNVEISINAKFYSLWNKRGVDNYLSLLLGIKRMKFLIWINGQIWDDNLMLERKFPVSMKVIPSGEMFIEDILCVDNLDKFGVQSVMLKVAGKYFNLTCPSSVALKDAVMIWNVMGIRIPNFDYFKVDGRKMKHLEYESEMLSRWPWGKVFELCGSLVGGAKEYVLEKVAYAFHRPEDMEIRLVVKCNALITALRTENYKYLDDVCRKRGLLTFLDDHETLLSKGVY